MRKFCLLLFVAIAASVTNCSAQDSTLSCNTQFNIYEYSSGFSFVPVYFGDSSVVTVHSWNFGDGNIATNIQSPFHQYADYGSYPVLHRVKRLDHNGLLICEDSTVQVVNNFCNLQSSFHFSSDSVLQNKIYFTNTSASSTGIDSLVWSFGDATYSSEINPSHTYTAAGVYNVCLTLRNNSCFDDTCVLIAVQVPAQNVCTLKVNFTTSPDSSAQNKIHFINLSTPLTPADSVTWRFGDGSFSNDLNPSHTFAAPGKYNVCLRIFQSDSCVKDYCSIVYIDSITPEPCYILPSFVSRQDSLQRNRIHFFNTSANTGISFSIRWDFGDGKLSYDQDPVHDYDSAGFYNVCMLIQIDSNCVSSVCQYVQVQTNDSCRLNANFVAAHGGSLKQMIFTNNAVYQPGTTAEWNFGDGTTSTEWNAEHTYQYTGNYTVCLKLKDSICQSSICYNVYVDSSFSGGSCNINASYYYYRDSMQLNKIQFINTSYGTGGDILLLWNFGDGNFSNETNPSHVFAPVGSYKVCLTMTKDSACFSDTCIMVNILSTDSCTVKAEFTMSPEEKNASKIRFNNVSSNAASIKSVYWDFGDGHSTDKFSPTHQYAKAGTYYICLKEQSMKDCVSVKCDSIIIAKPAVTCDSSSTQFTYQKDSYQPNKVYFFAGATKPGMQYNWQFYSAGGMGDTFTSSEPNPVHLFNDTGYYWVCLRSIDNKGCTSEYCNQVFINDTSATSQCLLQAYPNPTHNNLFISLDLKKQDPIRITVFNMQNILLMEQVKQGAAGSNKVEVNVQKLVPGFYVMRLTYGNQVCYVKFQKI